MSEAKRYIREEEEIYQAMYDTYRILTKKLTFDEFITEKDSMGQDLVLLFDNFSINSIKKKSVENVISYFSDLEEYEMCAELVEYKKRRGWK